MNDKVKNRSLKLENKHTFFESLKGNVILI